MNYHNPEQLTEWGQADGWRLLTTEEIKQPLPDDAEIRCADGRWAASGCRGAEGAGEVCTYRTKKPLPVSPLIAQLDAEIKALEEKKAVALAVEAGAEWEVDGGGTGTDWHDPDNEFAWYFREDRACAWQVRLKPKPVTSQTPRTDAAERDQEDRAEYRGYLVPARFARELESELTATRARLAELEWERAKMVLDFAATIKHVVTSMRAHQRNSLQRNVRIAELITENRKLREELEVYKEGKK